MNVKKLSIFFGILVLLFGGLFFMDTLKKDTVYGKPSDKLFPATRQLLNDSNYNNIILPNELDRKIADKESFFVYYFSADCGFCKQTTPVLKPLADEMGINLHQFNLLEYQEYFGKSNIQATPTLIAYKDGVEIDRIGEGLAVGNSTVGKTVDDFKAFFEKHKEGGNQ